MLDVLSLVLAGESTFGETSGKDSGLVLRLI
jgi:hypothetical protein